MRLEIQARSGTNLPVRGEVAKLNGRIAGLQRQFDKLTAGGLTSAKDRVRNRRKAASLLLEALELRVKELDDNDGPSGDGGADGPFALRPPAQKKAKVRRRDTPAPKKA